MMNGRTGGAKPGIFRVPRRKQFHQKACSKCGYEFTFKNKMFCHACNHKLLPGPGPKVDPGGPRNLEQTAWNGKSQGVHAGEHQQPGRGGQPQGGEKPEQKPSRIQHLQEHINRERAAGATEEEVAPDVQKLEKLRKERDEGKGTSIQLRNIKSRCSHKAEVLKKQEANTLELEGKFEALQQAIVDSRNAEQKLKGEVEDLNKQCADLEAKKAQEEPLPQGDKVKKQVAQHKALLAGLPEQIRLKHATVVQQSAQMLEALTAIFAESELFNQQQLQQQQQADAAREAPAPTPIPPHPPAPVVHFIGDANDGQVPAGELGTELHEADEEMHAAIETSFAEELGDLEGAERTAKKTKISKMFCQASKDCGMVKRARKLKAGTQGG